MSRKKKTNSGNPAKRAGVAPSVTATIATLTNRAKSTLDEQELEEIWLACWNLPIAEPQYARERLTLLFQVVTNPNASINVLGAFDEFMVRTLQDHPSDLAEHQTNQIELYESKLETLFVNWDGSALVADRLEVAALVLKELGEQPFTNYTSGLWQFTKKWLLKASDNADVSDLLEAFTNNPDSSPEVVAESLMWND